MIMRSPFTVPVLSGENWDYKLSFQFDVFVRTVGTV